MLQPEDLAQYKVLLNAERFTDDAIYAGGETPVEVVAWRHIFALPNARECFLMLAEHATLPGQLYALCGLYFLAPEQFAVLARRLSEDWREVDTQMGCTGGFQAVAEIVTWRKSDRIVLDDSDQTIGEWVKAHPERRAMRDISGGAYPSLFKHP